MRPPQRSQREGEREGGRVGTREGGREEAYLDGELAGAAEDGVLQDVGQARRVGRRGAEGDAEDLVRDGGREERV